MATKVLVFESDAAFAGELRNELGRLGCNTLIVDDGNVGLQQAASERPDLILLSIELPRMNGFSVCNKLKKDPALKDVPLIIMSSESSEETFEQHRKLRTRAEDYVHKPIAFGELLQHIQAFVRLGPPAGSQAPGPGSEGGILIVDDELPIISQDYVEDEGAMTQIAKRPDFPLPSKSKLPPPKIDKDVDDFADDAFDRLTGSSSVHPPEPAHVNGTSGAASAPPPPPPPPPPQVSEPAVARQASAPSVPRQQAAPAVQRHPSVPPRPAGVDQAEHDRVRAELDKAKSRSTDLERDLGAAKDEVSRLQNDMQRASKSDAESQRMQREIDELKAKLASGAKAGGGISSREFLDLREALNKKDKEILALRETLSKKDKSIVEAEDKSLSLERAKADLEDKSLANDRELADAKEKIESLTADKDLAKKASEDWKTRFERQKAELETKSKEAAAEKAKHAEEIGAEQAARAAQKSELEQVLRQEREASANAIAQLEATKTSEIEQAQRDGSAALADAKEQAAREKSEALAAAKSEHDAKLASLHRGHQQENAEQAKAASAKLSAELAAAAAKQAEELAALAAKHVEELDATRVQSASELDAMRAQSASELDAADTRRRMELSSAEDHHKAELDATLRSAQDKLALRDAELEAKRAAEVAAVERDRDNALAAQAQEHADKVLGLERERDTKIDAMAREQAERISSVENDRDAKVAELQSRLARELGEATDAADAARAVAADRIGGLEKELAGVVASLAALEIAKSSGDASHEAKIADLEERLAVTTATRDDHERSLASANDKIATLEAELAASRQDLGETKSRLGSESSRAAKAFAKWDSDRASLERAKDALAVALAQIEEAEGRPIAS